MKEMMAVVAGVGVAGNVLWTLLKDIPWWILCALSLIVIVMLWIVFVRRRRGKTEFGWLERIAAAVCGLTVSAFVRYILNAL